MFALSGHQFARWQELHGVMPAPSLRSALLTDDLWVGNKSMECVSDKFVYGGASTTMLELPSGVMPMTWLGGNQLGTFLYSVGRQFA